MEVNGYKVEPGAELDSALLTDANLQGAYKAMRRLVTTLRKQEFHDELRFLAAPGIDVDWLINTVLEPNFRELS